MSYSEILQIIIFAVLWAWAISADCEYRKRFAEKGSEPWDT